MDGRIRIFSNPMTLQTASLPRKYSAWPLNEMLSLLLSPTLAPDGACSVDNSHRGVLDTRMNPDMCGREIRFEYLTCGGETFESATEKKVRVNGALNYHRQI